MNRNEHNVNDELHCKHCGAELAEDSVFCEQCGKRVNPNKWLYIIPAFALLLVGGCFWLILGHESGNEPQPRCSFTVSVLSGDEAMGTAKGGGTYDTITTITIEAEANNGCQFVGWNDGNKEICRKVTVDHDQKFVAQFEKKPETPTPPKVTSIPKFLITVESSNPNMGTVTGGGEYDSLTNVTIEAKAKTGYRFIKWNDGDRNHRRTIKVESNQKYVAEFDVKPVPLPAPPKPAEIDWNGVAAYSGDIQDGKPYGSNGKLVFYRDYLLDLKKIEGTKLEIKAGESIEDTKFVNGKLRQGTLHRKDGTTKWFNI